jgi:hypothetical protein
VCTCRCASSQSVVCLASLHHSCLLPLLLLLLLACPQVIQKKLAWMGVQEAQQRAKAADDEEIEKKRQLNEARKAAKGDERPARCTGVCGGRALWADRYCGCCLQYQVADCMMLSAYLGFQQDQQTAYLHRWHIAPATMQMHQTSADPGHSCVNTAHVGF